MIVLGIETSCDETAAAVVTGEGEVLSDVVHSQVAVHAPYGGIIPELASRDHLRNIEPVVRTALTQARVGLEAISGIAVTCRPGLTGALMVGAQFAQGLGFSTGKPVVGIDHLVGHLLSAFLRYPTPAQGESFRPTLPFVALLASGGHTALYKVSGLTSEHVQELGATRDDAAGEAFDKVAKLLGLGYPGGPVIDRLAQEGDASRITLSRALRQKSSLEFSFSGLKSDVLRWVERNGCPGDEPRLRDLCAAFQDSVVQTLVSKAMLAAEREGVDSVVFGGGVSANTGLRARATAAARQRGLTLVIPSPRACTDNAAMIAYAGAQELARGKNDLGNLTISPRTALTRVTRKGPGRRN